MKVKTFGMAAAIAAALAIVALPAAAAPNDGRLGGPPEGVADDTICAGGAAVTGITGFTRIIGAFIPIVAVATVQCAGGGSASTMGSMTGSPDEAPGATFCLPGQVAVGIQGNEGDFVDHILLRCRPAPGGSGPITPSVPMFGGPFGTPDGPYDCPLGQVLTGLTGQSVFGGTTIRWVEIVCVPAPPVCPPDDDGDDDGLNDFAEKNSLFTLLGDADSDDDGIVDGNDDENENGEDDEDEDDEDECPDPDEDDDGEDDEDEDDD